MTDKEKLQRLFDAALKDTSEVNKTPTRAFPSPVFQAPRVLVPVVEPMVASVPAAVEKVVEDDLVVPLPNAGLDDATATELGGLLDEQRARLKRRHLRQTVGALAVCLALTGGGYGWFIQSPARVQAIQDAVREIRSVGDIQSLVAKYQASLDRIAARSQPIDHATTAMGVEPGSGGEADPYFDTEMQARMGGEGKTVGQRNQGLQRSFETVKKQNGQTPIPVSKVSDAESFEWNR
jgi:hypothetical protein